MDPVPSIHDLGSVPWYEHLNQTGYNNTYYRREDLLDEMESNNNTTIPSLNIDYLEYHPYTGGAVTLGYRIANYVLGISGSLLNILTLTALFRQKGSLKLRMKLIASLAVSDFIIACLSTIYHDYCFRNFWTMFMVDNGCFGFTTESLINSCFKLILTDIYTVSQYAGLFTLFAMSIDLLYAVKKPLQYRQLNTSNKGNIIVCVLWAVPLVTQLVISAMFVYSRLKPGQNYRPLYSELTPQLFFVISTLSALPFFVIYSCIICNLRRQNVTAPTTQNRNLRKIVFTVLLILGTYILCMMPYVWVVVVMYSDLNITHFSTDWILCLYTLRLLYVSNTLWDPIIFSVRIPEIRTGIKRILEAILCSRYRTSTRHGNRHFTTEMTQSTSV